MAMFCVVIGTSMTLFTAVSDTYVPLLATSEIQLGRELTLIPKKPKKKKKKKKKKRKKRKIK